MVSCTVCRRVKEPRAKVVVSIVFATTVGSQVIRSSSVVAKGGKARGKGQGKKGDSKGWNDRQWLDSWTGMVRWQGLEFFRQRLGATKASRNEPFGARLEAEGVRCSCDGGVDS